MRREIRSAENTELPRTSSDLIRFEQGVPGFGPSTVAFFYSLTADGVDSAADTVAILPTLQANNLTMTEVGPETGPNGLLYYTRDGSAWF